MCTNNYYIINNKKEDNLNFLRKIIIDYNTMEFKIKSSNDIKTVLSDIYYENLPDIITYQAVTRVRPSDFLWINDFMNYVPDNMVEFFCNLMLKVLIVKHSFEKIIENLTEF